MVVLELICLMLFTDSLIFFYNFSSFLCYRRRGAGRGGVEGQASMGIFTAAGKAELNQSEHAPENNLVYNYTCTVLYLFFFF